MSPRPLVEPVLCTVIALTACATKADVSPRTTPPTVAQARGRMTIGEARRYMVALINRDRASAGLAPVELDESAPMHAGQSHAEDMAAHGYLGHYGTDGSVPEQRFTQAGGADMVLENSSCFDDERPRSLDRTPVIEARNVEVAEDSFFHEVPPHDGHRKNILTPWHKKVGIGIAQPVATEHEIPVPCFAQEFVDHYGTYAPLPRVLGVGSPLHVEGTIDAPASFSGVGIARVDAPKPLSVHEVNQRRSYLVPVPYQMYWPPGFVTPVPVKITGNRFQIDLLLSDHGKTGMYEVSVWAIVPGSKEPTLVGLRSLQVR